MRRKHLERPVGAATDRVDSPLVRWIAAQEGGAIGRVSRRLAARTSRRSLFARSGKVALALVGFAALPALPVDRSPARAQEGPDEKDKEFEPGEGDVRAPTAERYDGTDPTVCNYWRYCNMHGTMCPTCGGGGVTTCPAGTNIGQEYWVGCCENPEDGQTYLIAYIDCCGRSVCGEGCGEGWQQATPYDSRMPSQDNNILWCQSDETQAYSCTVSPIISDACSVYEVRSREDAAALPTERGGAAGGGGGGGGGS